MKNVFWANIMKYQKPEKKKSNNFQGKWNRGGREAF